MRVSGQEVALAEAKARQDSLEARQKDDAEALKAAMRFVDRVKSEIRERHDADEAKVNKASARYEDSQDRVKEEEIRTQRLTKELAGLVESGAVHRRVA